MSAFRERLDALCRELHVPSPVQSLTPDWPGAQAVHISIKRDDLIHPVISGNKWRKLSPTLLSLSSPPSRLISFGGGFSNHLHALGYASHRLQLPFTAFVRGDYRQHPTPMLRDLHHWGTDVRYLTKADYRRRHDPAFVSSLHGDAPQALVIPEGGSQQSALAGIQHSLKEQPLVFDTVICPVASGATLAGLVSALEGHQQAMGIAVLKGQQYLESLVSNLLDRPYANWHIEHAYHHGGYARNTDELIAFCDAFETQTSVPAEPVYSGKMLFAVRHMISKGMFPEGHRVLLIHTGGLQGARSY
ncbi:1-aminocyclopropane-1-carboxylate deaminase/D-cysteine desulfhydrase [Alteromonas halophila]|uniref:1-aminocyclopropane-1-carboxylate deaminase n=1 Tax=Alteromonas halophila TaxID=516698 RepID=A0A918N1A0_9ALTE|nr:pyridoxal-phosphate dependent enzyme [Alteromonas halophila]GGW96978.1 1-aminocyclopropane-1-carboxylate deaminase [Alteromonas halophila]